MTGIMCRPRNSARFFGSCCCQLFCLAWTSRIPTVIWVGRSSMRGTVCRTGSRTATMVNLPSVGWAKSHLARDSQHVGTQQAMRLCPRGQAARSDSVGNVAKQRRCPPYGRIPASPYRSRRHCRAGGALELERLHHERELGDVLGGEFVELEVLQEVHAIDYQCDLVQWQRDQLVRIGVDLDWRRVGAEQDRILGDQKFGGLDADAGIAPGVASRLRIPQLAPAGMDDDGVARLEREVLLPDRAFEVFDGDLVSVAQHGDALVAGNVDQYSTSHQ